MDLHEKHKDTDKKHIENVFRKAQIEQNEGADTVPGLTMHM